MIVATPSLIISLTFSILLMIFIRPLLQKKITRREFRFITILVSFIFITVLLFVSLLRLFALAITSPFPGLIYVGLVILALTLILVFTNKRTKL